MHICKIFAVLSLMFSSGLALADMTFLVQDQHGAPIANAVLEIVSNPSNQLIARL